MTDSAPEPAEDDSPVPLQGDYPWLRITGETDTAYDAFRVYLRRSPRSQAKAAEELGKSVTVINRWAHRYRWVDRATAYDRYVEMGATDGLVDEMVRVRSRHLAVADKLLDHLDRRLDHYIATNQDPSVRWTQALAAAAKVQEVALRLKDNKKESGMFERALELLERLERE